MTLNLAFQELRDALQLMRTALNELQSICEQEREAGCEQIAKNLLRQIASKDYLRVPGSTSQPGS